MKIDQTVLDRTGRTLIQRGVLLDDYMIEALMNRGVPGIYTAEGEEDELGERETVSEKTLEIIEKLKVQDRAKVTLSESVKERVAQGVSFLYNNTESEDFIDATNNIAEDLMKSIMENDAIAVDVSELKVSDEYTFKHSVDVATMAMVIGKKHGLSEREVHEIGIAGLLHDIGKTKIPAKILNKPEKLTDEEFEIMKQHSLYGYKILKEKGDISDGILMGVLQHHEKLNGNGYPMGVPDEKIITYAKLLSIVDIYDALVTDRVYKKAFSPRDAVEMIMAMTDELDINAMHSFLNSMILYPVGSTVKLSNGERARVVENNPQWILRPKVVGLKTGKVYDLAEDLKCANIIIV